MRRGGEGEWWLGCFGGEGLEVMCLMIYDASATVMN